MLCYEKIIFKRASEKQTCLFVRASAENKGFNTLYFCLKDSKSDDTEKYIKPNWKSRINGVRKYSRALIVR